MNTSKNVTPVTKVETANPEAEVKKPELSNVMVPPTGEKTEVINEVKKVEAPSIEKRMQKLKELNQLQEKREKVLGALENVKGFSIDTTSEDCYLKLSDGNGTGFKISNTEVIEELVLGIKDRLKLELEKIEAQFNFSI